MDSSGAAYLESQWAAFGGDFEREYALERDPQPTGIRALDDALGGGLACGAYTVVGGTAGVGKSALGCAVLYGIAAAGGNPIYVSCEMPAQQVRMRLASSHAARTPGLVPFEWGHARDAFRARFTRTQLQRFQDAPEDVREEWAGKYADRFGDSDPAICAWRDMVRRGIAQRAMVREDVQSLEGVARLIEERASFGIRDAVIVDYAQLLDVPGAEKEYDRMTAVSRTLQQAAKRAGCPVLLISSLKNLRKDETEPNLTWFRGSGYLGYDAGAAIVLKGAGWASYDDMAVDAYIIKNRTGRVPDGPLQMVSRPKHGLFE